MRSRSIVSSRRESASRIVRSCRHARHPSWHVEGMSARAGAGQRAMIERSDASQDKPVGRPALGSGRRQLDPAADGQAGDPLAPRQRGQAPPALRRHPGLGPARLPPDPAKKLGPEKHGKLEQSIAPEFDLVMVQRTVSRPGPAPRSRFSIAPSEAAASMPRRTSASATRGLYSRASRGKRSWRIRARVRERSALLASSR